MKYEISEQTVNDQAIYHWTIRDEDGNEVSHSAYHTDRAKCEAEAAQRIADYIATGSN